MNQTDLKAEFELFKKITPLVIGDVMVDSYLWGEVNRISPEAPVPIIDVLKSEDRLGGAANVIRNFISLNTNPVLCAVIGNDYTGEVFKNRLEHYGINTNGIVVSDERPTTRKTRVLGEHQQMLRIDEEDIEPLTENEELSLLEKVQYHLNNSNIDVVVLEDYNKGVLTKKVISQTIEWCNQKDIPVTVDPKKVNFWEYSGADLFKPNLREIEEGLKRDIDPTNKSDLDKAFSELVEKLNIGMALITLSEHGVYINHKGNSELIPAVKREVADVSGAGDTVISVASLCLALKMEPELIAKLSNLAGGLVCERVGVVPITAETLLTEALKLKIGIKE